MVANVGTEGRAEGKYSMAEFCQFGIILSQVEQDCVEVKKQLWEQKRRNSMKYWNESVCV